MVSGRCFSSAGDSSSRRQPDDPNPTRDSPRIRASLSELREREGSDKLFVKWAQRALGVSRSSAYYYRDGGAWFSESPTVGKLPARALYKGASAPAEVKHRVVEMLESGELPTEADIKRLIKDHVAEHPIEHNLLTSDAEQRDPKPRNPEAQAAVIAAREVITRLRDSWNDDEVEGLLSELHKTSIEVLWEVFSETPRNGAART